MLLNGKHPSLISRFCDQFGPGRSIPVAVNTRWNSMYRQMQAFFKIPNMDLKALGNVCQGSMEFCSALLTSYERRQLCELLAVFWNCLQGLLLPLN